jgi:hypothetical protein
MSWQLATTNQPEENMQLGDTTRTNREARISTDIGATGYLFAYTSSAPAKTAAATGTKLISMPTANPFGTASGGVLTASAISNQNGLATGTPGYFRICSSSLEDGSNVIVQGTAAIGSGEMNFSAQVSLGGQVSVTSIALTDGNS